MAISRLLYSSQTALITVGGHLNLTGGYYQYATNVSDVVKETYNSGTEGTGTPAKVTTSGFDKMRDFLLPIQSISADETIPQEDVLVLGKLGGAARVQKDVASSKVTLKAYLADYMKWQDGSNTFDDGILSWKQPEDPNDIDGSEGMEAYGTLDTDDTSDTYNQNVYGRQIAKVLAESSTTDGLSFPGGDSSAAQTTPAAYQQYGAWAGPYPGITVKGGLAGEAIIQNGVANDAAIAKFGLLEQLAWESMGGFEARVQLFRPQSGGTQYADGFIFYGIMSSLSIDASKGAYPTLDLSFEGIGQLQYLNMGTKDSNGVAVEGENSFDWYIHSCHPHTSDELLVWGRAKEFDANGDSTNGATGLRTLIAGNKDNFYQDTGYIVNGTPTGGNWVGTASTIDDLELALQASDGTTGRQSGDPGQGDADVISSAKFSYDMPTETLSTLGAAIEGITSSVRPGNQTFSKPPYKANLTLDGQGLIMAGWEKVTSGVIREQVVPNGLQLGDLHCTIGAGNAGVSSRSFSQNVGDVGATYNVSTEGTSATFFATYQDADRDIA